MYGEARKTVGSDMSSNSIGEMYRLTSFGESHGECIGGVIDGCPSGLSLCEDEINEFLKRRAPGASSFASSRKEKDKVKILSGVFEGVTTGCSIGFLVENQNARSSDYEDIKNVYRPSHGDYTYSIKYGIRDYRGGGRASGRETISRCVAGYIAIKILGELGISFKGDIKSVLGISYEKDNLEEIKRKLMALKEKGDTAGGVISLRIRGVKAGIGEPVFSKLDSELAKAIMSIGAVKAVEFGEGIHSSMIPGSLNNDAFYSENGKILKKSNRSGGIIAGISDGDDILLNAYFKAAPSIALLQDSVNVEGENVKLSIKGRHDPLIIIRAIPVVESMAAMIILDMIMRNQSSRISYLKKIYKEELI